MFKKSIVKTNYYIELTEKQTRIILTKDNDNNKSLYEYLFEIVGVYNVDYDYAFGNGLWLSVDKEDDNKKTWELINLIISIYIMGCLK